MPPFEIHVLQPSSTQSPPSRTARVVAAHAPTSAASARWDSAKNGQSRCDRSMLIPLELRLLPGDERVVRPAKIGGLHADRLRLRLRLDRGVEIHRPFLVQELFGHA